MNRVGLTLLLLQGSLFTSLATDVTTTPTPSPTTEKGRKQTGTNTEIPLYKVNTKGGEVCILMELDAYVSINWAVALNETKEVDMILQSSKVEASGSCSEEEAELILTWGSFRLQWNFSKTRDWKKWFVNQVELQYDKSALDHQNNTKSEVVRASTRSSSAVLLFSAPLGEAYHCADGADEELDLGVNASDSDGAMLRLRRFRLQPFLAAPLRAFGPSYCPTHISSSSYESSTPSSETSAVTATKTATHPSSDTSNRPHVASQGPNPVTDHPLKTTSSNRYTGSTASSANSLSSHSPNPSAVPFSGSTKAPVLDQTTHHEELTSRKTSEFVTYTPVPQASLPPYVYQKSLPNVVKMSYYPPKKMFFSGIKLDNNDALSAMLWSWYTSGFYTGYYQALQQSKKY